MAKPSSRETLIEYCLRRLGAPVLEINVDEDQINDRIDDALQYFQEYNSDAIQRVYLKHQITAEDIANGYIELSDAVTSVTRIFPISASSSRSNFLFDVTYQLRMNDLYSLNFTGSLVDYTMMKQYMATLDLQLNGSEELIRFNRHMNQLFIDVNWATDLPVGTWIIIECYRIIDPDEFSDIYNDMLLKQYATALLKRQWAQNLIKFENMTLPGGVTLNTRQMWDDANNEIDKIEESIQLKYEFPPMFTVG